MSIEERILNDSSCSAYVDTNRKYVEIAFRDGAEWGYEKGFHDAIDKACKWMEWIRRCGSFYDTYIAEDSIRDFRKTMECSDESILDYIKLEEQQTIDEHCKGVLEYLDYIREEE